MVRDQEPLSERIVRTVATVTNTDPIDLPTLYGAVDPDALDTLVDGMAMGEVTFTYAGCEVTVTDEETIRLNGAAVGEGTPETTPVSN